ncbi:ABC transporter ATP-binding protein [Lacicoccus alkaliphilus]|uniref:ABC-2 type transport system ATP-binding protein n=1 Tax=Lacicoccus alkaliphilus DSM 16010 TaxID=1123231 RepID=A0A1M7J5U9_9BACL|nr:ABC transporter ATP-binding protein [Salinicoccus alkaliphilus]SHM48253.1 ABC-2 type transport system ATP-binding protein [Salinicoccus alkaliphilus DSM 16010]
MSLILSDLTKRFGDFTAVDTINIEVPAGSMYGFLGGNGAGKTTTFRMLLGLLAPTAGEITYKGEKIGYEMTDSIGYLPEERGLHPKLRVDEQIQYLARLKGMKKHEIDEKLEFWLEEFEVPENKHKKIEKLSKGNQQKIQLIASIIHEPELIILDEPFSGLDPVNVEILKKAVKNLNHNGATILFSTHRMDHVEELCEELCILNKGTQVVSGNIDDIKADFGQKELIIEGRHDISFLKDFPGVIEMKTNRNKNVIRISEERYAEDIYNEIIKLGYFKRFQVNEPSLNDIFIAKVGRQYE